MEIFEHDSSIIQTSNNFSVTLRLMMGEMTMTVYDPIIGDSENWRLQGTYTETDLYRIGASAGIRPEHNCLTNEITLHADDDKALLVYQMVENLYAKKMMKLKNDRVIY